MKKFRRRVTALVVISLLAVAYATALLAAPYREYYITYYEDPEKTIQCGYKNQYCWGATWGGSCVNPPSPYKDVEWGAYCAGGGGCDDPYDPECP